MLDCPPPGPPTCPSAPIFPHMSPLSLHPCPPPFHSLRFPPTDPPLPLASLGRVSRTRESKGS